jgi:hypothetical protein
VALPPPPPPPTEAELDAALFEGPSIEQLLLRLLIANLTAAEKAQLLKKFGRFSAYG